jgi:class 3 adenylate cyclase
MRCSKCSVRRHEGYVAQSTRDGIFALFGAPAAYEDHPRSGQGEASRSGIPEKDPVFFASAAFAQNDNCDLSSCFVVSF